MKDKYHCSISLFEPDTKQVSISGSNIASSIIQSALPFQLKTSLKESQSHLTVKAVILVHQWMKFTLIWWQYATKFTKYINNQLFTGFLQKNRTVTVWTNWHLISKLASLFNKKVIFAQHLTSEEYNLSSWALLKVIAEFTQAKKFVSKEGNMVFHHVQTRLIGMGYFSL